MKRTHPQSGELGKQGVQFGLFGDGAIEIKFDLLPDLRQALKKAELFFIHHLCFPSAPLSIHDQHFFAGTGTEDTEKVFRFTGFRGEKFTGDADMCMKDAPHVDS
jgi:hypothetical protein